ncbi:MAG TPA: DUF4010 domain-containing protein [Gemmatimonadales bacterium]|nr:DUF4010 domain-containing protein [Gemmatimonadales bacterium]
MLQLDTTAASELAVAALAGLAVGIEREWSGHASGPGARFAGARTFLLLGILGGLAGWLIGGGELAAGVALLAAGCALTVAAYIMTARLPALNPEAPSVEGTTEVAALLVLGLGMVAGLGFPLLTSAVVSVMVLALIEKTRIHGAIRQLGETEFAAALQFAVLALVVLPLLPEGPYGPYGSIRPRALWTAVLLFSAINFAGYVARRAVGLRRGYRLTGLVGGLVSSTAVTLSFSRESRAEPAAGWALASGVIGACTVLCIRVLVFSGLLNGPVAVTLVPYVIPVLLVGAGLVALALRRPEPDQEPSGALVLKSPLGLWAAIKMAAAFQLVLIVVPYVQELWGPTAVNATAALLGLTDMDALTYAMTRLAPEHATAAAAAQGIAVGILSNTVFKLAIALVLGVGAYRKVAGSGLLALAAASGIGLWIVH